MDSMKSCFQRKIKFKKGQKFLGHNLEKSNFYEQKCTLNVKTIIDNLYEEPCPKILLDLN
jgi:hypothetical protein